VLLRESKGYTAQGTRLKENRAPCALSLAPFMIFSPKQAFPLCTVDHSLLGFNENVPVLVYSSGKTLRDQGGGDLLLHDAGAEDL